MILDEWDRRLVATALGRMNLSDHLSHEDYVELFGRVTAVAPFGERLWEGMERLRMAHHKAQWYPNMVRGFFWCPRPFGQRYSQMPLSEDEHSRGRWYPAYFYEITPGLYMGMYCEALLLLKAPAWKVHISRCELYPQPALQ